MVAGPAVRLDKFLLAHAAGAGLGRRRLGTLLAGGAVRVNDRPARKGTVVRAGDEITLAWSHETPAATTDPVLVVLYRDDDVVVVDKPPGVPSTIGRTPGPSLAAALLAHFPEMAAIDATRAAGLAHRLDTGTSGLLVAGRHPLAYTRLRGEFARKAVAKTYLAVVIGRIDHSEVVNVPLTRHRRSRGRMVPARDAAKAWPARTEITPIESDGALSLVRLRMRTGVTHQLRLHLALLGHPVVGDRRYGPKEPALATTIPCDGAWHFLHARALHFDAADLPPDLTTAFPAHWRPLMAARGWSLDDGA